MVVRPEDFEFDSRIERAGSVTFPLFGGVRILMMPFRLEDIEGSTPHALSAWRETIAAVAAKGPVQTGTAYLTIDEAIVGAGETHRRPGIHVDGVGPEGAVIGADGTLHMKPAGWGGGNGTTNSLVRRRPAKKRRTIIPLSDIPQPTPPRKPLKKERHGMLLAASHPGYRGWNKTFVGLPGPDGDCAHLALQCGDDDAMTMLAGEVFWCEPLGVHQTLPLAARTPRQMIRISLPNNAPWHLGCTPNPLGILPEGPIAPARPAYMAHRP